MLGFMVRKKWKRGASKVGKISETVDFSKSELEKCFDQQTTKVLNPQTYPEAEFKISVLASLLELLRKKIPEKIPCEESNIPILLVLGNFLPLDEQLKGMQFREKDRECSLHPYLDHKYLPRSPLSYTNTDLPYLLFDVEPGEKTKGISEEKCRKIFSVVERLGLDIYEVVALITQFSKYCLNYSGSLETYVISNPGSMTSRKSDIFVHQEHVIFPPIWGRKRVDWYPIKILAGEKENDELIEENRCWPSCKKRLFMS